MEKLFLIDAYALIFRSYYAFLKHPSLNSKGMNTSAIMGFCNTLQEIMQKEKPTYLGVAFDHGKTFRHEAFPAYKAQRDETPEDIKQSVPWIKDILKALRIPVYQADGFEADDVIGTLATKAGQAGVKTFMLTPDKDYGQLVSDNVMMYKPRHGGGYDVIDKTALTSQYGISTPDQVIDLLALMGDSADNFPGCPGVGEKTAVKLINEFGSVDALLQHTDQLKGKMKEKVEGAVDDIKMSKFLATIRTDVPIELKLDEMKVKSPDESELTKIFGELEFKRLLSKFVNKPIESQNKVNNEPDIFSLFPADSQEEDKNQSFQSLKDIAHVYKLIETEEDAQKLYDFLMTKQIISLDTETTSTNAIDAELVGLSFSVEENKAFYVAIPKDREKALRIVNIFKSLYEEPSILKVGQNIKYDYEVLCNYGVRIGGKMWDTMLAHYIIQPELKHNMDDMAEQLLHYKTIHIEELIGPKGKGQKNMADLKPEEIYEYAAEDADVTLKLKNVLQPKLKEVEGAKLFEDIEMPLVPVLADMEMNGVCIDTEALKETSRIFTERMNDYEQRVYTEAGERFNISSPKQVGDILFAPDKMHILDKPKKTRTGQYVTSEEVLQSVATKAPIVQDILNYRGMKKLLSTYVDALPKLINKRTGHIHTSFNQALTATGRLSSSDPNLQNIPVRTDDGKEIRK
ncbi:MAG: DNA polymerase I, partial [Prevotella sp.]